jgi:hypothetical protein
MNNSFYDRYFSDNNSGFIYCQYNKITIINAKIFETNFCPKKNEEIESDNAQNENSSIYYITNTSNKKDKIININEEQKENIFHIEKKTRLNKLNKKLKKKGRKKKEFNTVIINNKNENNFHSKLNEDNIIQKIKVFFINSSMIFINNTYEDYQLKKGKKNERFLQKIKSEYANIINKEKNLEFLHLKMKDLFSSNLSGKCTKHNKDLNKHKIMKLYKKNEAKEVIKILDKTVEELLNNYVNGDYKDKGFYIELDMSKKLDINDIYDINKYIEKFIQVAKNFRRIFERKISRKKKLNIYLLYSKDILFS